MATTEQTSSGTVVKTYSNPHPFNPFLMHHYYLSDGKVRRVWTKKRVNTSADVKQTSYSIDGSMALEELVEDIRNCFCFTSVGGVMTMDGKWDYYDEYEMEERKLYIDIEMLTKIYETKLPPSTEVYQYRTATVMETMCISDLIDVTPQTYYDLFEIIGVECEYGPPQKVGKYTIWQYPDSSKLTLNAKDNKLFFGYSR